MNRGHLRILTEMLTIPTTPFAEHFVIDHIERFCANRKGVAFSADASGNLLIHVHKGKRRVARPPCLTAHLDHPGFVADRMVSKKRLRAHWRGGVLVEYFAGSRVRFYVGGTRVSGRIRSVTTTGPRDRRRVDVATIDVASEVPPGSIGMWDLPDSKVRGTRIHAPDCDDMAGAAAMLCCIDALSRSTGDCDAYFLFTRAEEVGFVGAMAAARAGTIPGKCYVICTETSSELPHARIGDGPVLRVGDRVSTFTSEVTAYCNRVATDLARTSKSFQYQRKLMDGGMCEATAYCTLGYEATCICLALGNYHNMDKQAKNLAPEYVDLCDFDSLVRWFVALARTPHMYTGRDDALQSRLTEIQRTHRKLLRQSIRKPK